MIIELGEAVTEVGAPTIEELITTSSVEVGHAPFSKVQRMVLFPIPKPVTAEVGDVALVGVPDPLTNDHVPPAVRGVFAAIVVEFAQMV